VQQQQRTITILGDQATYGQQQIVGAVLDPKVTRLIISAMTRYGKTYFVAKGLLLIIANTPISLHQETQKILIVAPTLDQTNIIRNYIASHIAKSRILSGLLDKPDRASPERLKSEMSKKRLTFKNGWEIITLTAHGNENETEPAPNLMGFGGKIVVLDEACLILHKVYTQRISRMLGDYPDSKLITIVNPWNMLNFAYQQWTDPAFKKIHINWQQALAEGRTTETYLKEQKQLLSDYEWDVLYESNFSKESEDALIRYDWILNATKTVMPLIGPVQTVWGLDVAEQGSDLTILTEAYTDGIHYQVRRQQWVHEQETIPAANKVSEIVPKRDIINVDSIGVGAGVYSQLKTLKHKVNSIRVSMCPDDESDRYLNQKSQRYWALRSLFEQGLISIPNDAILISQLSQMRYEFTAAGKIKIIDPPTKSPDYADSLMLMLQVKTHKPSPGVFR
jgi:hypothetical protein